LTVVLVALVAMMVALASASLIGVLGKYHPAGIDPRGLFLAHASFWVATGVSLLGKLKLRIDGQASAAPRTVDASIVAGLVPMAVMTAVTLFAGPQAVSNASVVAVPVSFLLFVRFLQSSADRLGRADLAARAGRLFRFALNMLIIALVGAAFTLLDPAIGSLLIFGAMLASCFAAVRYGKLLFEMRRLV
jgi:hypothetical protein